MKYLSDYTEADLTALFNKCGAFYAFGQKQFDEKMVAGVDYRSIGSGLVCPLENCKTLVDESEKIYRAAIQQDIAENGTKAIILRELANHECWYVGDPTEAIEKLKDYGEGFTKAEIIPLYQANFPSY